MTEVIALLTKNIIKLYNKDLILKPPKKSLLKFLKVVKKK